MAGIVIGAIVGSVVSEAVGAVVADAVLGMVIESGITAVAADVLGASLATASFIGGATGLVAGGVANLAVQSLIGSNSPSSAQSALSSAQAQGILINSQSNVDPIPVIYGRRRVGGTRVFIEVSGSSNEYLHLVLVLADEDPALLHAIVTRRNYGSERFSGGCADKDGPGGRPSTAPGCAPGPYSMSAGAYPSNDLMKESWQGADAMMPSLVGPLLVHSYHVLAGIRTAEALEGAGFRNFSILPSPVPGLLWLNSTVDSPLGAIVVNWIVVSAAPPAPTRFFLEVVVPPGATALVGVPSASASDAVFEGARPLRGAQWRAGRSFVRVGSGQFFFNSTLPAASARDLDL